MQAQLSNQLLAKKIQHLSNSQLPCHTLLDSMFNDPSSYLKLPSECSIPYMIGKQITGPRFDVDDQIIPYSYVGNPSIFRKKNTIFANNSRISSMSKKTTIRENKTAEDRCNHISDNEVQALFGRYQNNIENNKERGNDFLNTLPQLLREKNMKPLLLQQTILINHKNNEIITKKIAEKIKLTMETKPSSTKSSKASTINTSTSSSCQELLMESIDSFRMKKEAMKYLQTTNEYKKNHNKYNWAITLRKGKHWKGTRKDYINVGSNKHPIWSTIIEKLPIINETIRKPNDSKTIENESTESYIKTNPFFKEYMNKTLNMADLEVKGNSLLKVEQDNIKKIKGKKRIVHYHYSKESLENINFIDNWNYN